VIDSRAQTILAVNSGSSSLKVGLFQVDDELTEVGSIIADGIGTPSSRLKSTGISDDSSRHGLTLADHDAAIRAVLGRLNAQSLGTSLTGIGYRIVHGGRKYTTSGCRIDESTLAYLDEVTQLAPEHMPQALTAVRLFRQEFPSLPHVACFDTAFHRTMSSLAQQYPLPDTRDTADIIRYGFHGLSCESVLMQLRRVDPDAVNGRLVIAHLGNGASMTAIRYGQSVDTTMGFTPTGGLMMGTRTGDLDPGVLLYLLSTGRMTLVEVNELVNRCSGLKGVSGWTSEMRDLLHSSGTDPKAANAIALYCYLARKQLGALSTVLGGLETLVFTGGIGEHAPAIRSGICANLDFLGVALNENRNERDATVISRDDARVTVRVLPSDEDRVIAQHTYASIKGEIDDIPL